MCGINVQLSEQNKNKLIIVDKHCNNANIHEERAKAYRVEFRHVAVQRGRKDQNHFCILINVKHKILSGKTILSRKTHMHTYIIYIYIHTHTHTHTHTGACTHKYIT